jgi:hypothetical protein
MNQPGPAPTLQSARDETLLHELRAAALAAITIADRDGASDANPHTAELTAYDLARIFCPAMNDRDHVARTLDGLATTIRLTSGSHARSAPRRQARARWVAWELRRLGDPVRAEFFDQLASRQPTERHFRYTVARVRNTSNGRVYDIASPGGELAGVVIDRPDTTRVYLDQQGADLAASLRPAYDDAVKACVQAIADPMT